MLKDHLNSYQSSQSYKKGKIRFLLLFSIVLVAFGNQYAFNNPQALQESLYEHLSITQTQFQLFYSLYSLPNVFTLIFIGYYLDKFGMRIGFIILSLGLVLFQLLFAIGAVLINFKLMLFARVLFGVASRSLFIPQAAIISFWFKGNQLSFALGIGITFPQLGNALNSYLTPIIYEQTKTLGPPLFMSVGICCIGFIGTLLACYLDKKAQKLDAQNDIKTQISQYQLDTTQTKHQSIKLSDIKELNNTFWIISLLCTLTMAQYIPFLDNANRLYQKRFCFLQTTAGQMVMITYVATAFFSGPLGLLVNYVGYRRFFIMGATFIFLTAHMMIWLYPQCIQTPQYPSTIGLLFLGIGFSFYANVIVAAIPMVVKKKVLGTALGIMQIISSLAQCLIPLFTGYLIQNSQSTSQGFMKSSFFFVIIGLTGVSTSILLFFIQKKMKKRLDKGKRDKNMMAINFNEFDIEIPSTSYKKIEQKTRQSTLLNIAKNLLPKQSSKDRKQNNLY